MRAGNSCKKSLSLREFSVRVLWAFFLVGCWVRPAGAVDFWDITVVDSEGDMRDPSLAILPSGHSAISYHDDNNQNLKYAWYDGNAWQMQVVDSTQWAGNSGTSLAILPSGYPAISYDQPSNRDLKYTWYDGSVWQNTIVDTGLGFGGPITSLAILQSGYPAISYYDRINDDLKYAWYDGSTWQNTIVDSTGDVGRSNSLAILPSGQPTISYSRLDYPNRTLKYAWYDGTTWQTSILDSGGEQNSLAILPSGQPAISYTAGGLKYAWYDGSSWQTSIVDSEGNVGAGNSLAILPSGQPAISYIDSHNGDIKYAWYDGSSWHKSIADWKGIVGFGGISLAVLPSGQPAITYGGYNHPSSLDLMFATPIDVGPATVSMTASYTSTAWTQWGGTTVVIDGPAYNFGEFPYGWVESSVRLETTYGGHLRGAMAFFGQDGQECLEWECVEWDPETGDCTFWECLEWETLSCRDANGTVSGTINIGTSESYPQGSELVLALEVLAGGDPGDAEDYYLQLWRGPTLLGQIEPASPEGIEVPVEAGETLTFELFASEEDWYGDYEFYNLGYEFRLILRGPANFDGKGTVNFRDYAILGLAWMSDPNQGHWNPACDISEPNDNVINRLDLDVFTDHWLE